MFKKLLKAIFKKGSSKKSEKGDVKKMAELENVKKEEVVDEKETTKGEEIAENKKVENKDTEVKGEEKKEEIAEEKADETTEQAPQVQETEEQGNGVRVEDLVTKDMLADRLSALEAKFDAVIKENEDLKAKLTNKEDELNGMKDKYENKDFGNTQKVGATRDAKANNAFADTYAEYAKQFM